MTVRQKIAIALASAVLTLLVGVAALAVVIRLRGAIAAVDHTNAVIRNLDGALGAMVDAETGQRGYIITGDSGYLGPYHDGRVAVDSYVVALRRLVADDPHQEARLDTLERLANAKVHELDESVRLRAVNAPAALAHVRSGVGKELMDSSRVIANHMTETERRRLAQRDQTRLRIRNLALGVIVGGTVGAFLLAFVTNRSIRSDVIAQQRTQEQLEVQAKQLEEQQVAMEETLQQLRETTAQAEEARDA